MRNLLVFVLFLSTSGFASQSFIQIPSQNGVEATKDKLVSLIKEKGMTLFAEIDHKKNAEAAGLKLKPSHVVVFGNPMVGTVLMNENATMGLELPLKIHVFVDESNKVFLRYYSPEYYKSVYGIKNKKVLSKMSGALKKLTNKAAKKI